MDDATLPRFLDHLSDGVLILDEQDRVLHPNQAALRHLDLPRAELEGSPCPIGTAPPPDAVEVAGERFTVTVARLPWRDRPRRTLILRPVDPGETRDTQVTRGILHNLGNVLSSIGIATSQLRGLRDDLRVDLLSRTAKVLAAAEDPGAFLDSHGDRMPRLLSGLARHQQAEIQRLEREVRFLDESLDHARSVLAAGQRFADTMGHEESVSVDVLLDLVLDFEQAHLQRARVAVERERGDLPPVTVDRHQILQILHNLVRNAIQAMEHDHVAERRLRLRTRRDGGGIAIEIADTGIGLSPTALHAVFEEGYTTREEGQGWGLPTSRRAARDLGGDLAARSDGEGRGATFVLTLPRLRAVRERPAALSWSFQPQRALESLPPGA